jgi:hypothetical protein
MNGTTKMTRGGKLLRGIDLALCPSASTTSPVAPNGTDGIQPIDATWRAIERAGRGNCRGGGGADVRKAPPMNMQHGACVQSALCPANVQP